MRRPSSRAVIVTLFVVLLAALVLPGLLGAQAPTLAFNAPTSGVTGPRGQAVKYRVSTDAAGVLTVAASGGADLTLAVTDEDGQELRDGTADRDLRGEVGSEYLAVVVPRAGRYGVEVRTNGQSGGVAFRVVATFAPMPEFAVAADPDGRPGTARAIAVGAAQDDQLDPDAGDLADWYAITATEAMTLIVITRVEDETEGDIVLEAFVNDALDEPAARSDQDLRGNAGNESLTVDVKAGERVLIKVGSLNDSGERFAYRVSLGRMP
ncbi:MAG: hypothetical protein WD771_06810 [Gemmatimonadaceae bacterium]